MRGWFLEVASETIARRLELISDTNSDAVRYVPDPSELSGEAQKGSVLKIYIEKRRTGHTNLLLQGEKVAILRTDPNISPLSKMPLCLLNIKMRKTAFLQHLRETAELLKPFTIQSSPGAKHWNGTAYVESEPAPLEPGALAWWSTLTAIAEMIDNQDTPLSARQAAYLDGLLFGGMGSLNDLSIRSHDRKNADAINAKLDRQRRLLFQSFKG